MCGNWHCVSMQAPFWFLKQSLPAFRVELELLAQALNAHVRVELLHLLAGQRFVLALALSLVLSVSCRTLGLLSNAPPPGFDCSFRFERFSTFFERFLTSLVSSDVSVAGTAAAALVEEEPEGGAPGS